MYAVDESNRFDTKSLCIISQIFLSLNHLNTFFTICINGVACELMEGNIDMTELSRRVYDNIWDGPDRKLMAYAHVSSNYSAKLRRWWMNRWKNKLVYDESIISQFYILMKSHFINPYKGL